MFEHHPFNGTPSDPFRTQSPSSESTSPNTSYFTPSPLRPKPRYKPRPNLSLFPAPTPLINNPPAPSNPVNGPRFIRSISSFLRIPSSTTTSSLVANAPKCQHGHPILPVSVFTGEKPERSVFDVGRKRKSDEKLRAGRAPGCRRCALLDLGEDLQVARGSKRRSRLSYLLNRPPEPTSGRHPNEWLTISSPSSPGDVRPRRAATMPVMDLDERWHCEHLRQRAAVGGRAYALGRTHCWRCRIRVQGQRALEWVLGVLCCRGCTTSERERRAGWAQPDDLVKDVSPSRLGYPGLNRAERRSVID
ncbi:MAG: hypothetical protein M1828_001303 [Chrysothrix sp. TS-e1954]|nr:MAG: hypothetical protein M1828_001303 [Chrysothrix sp. TS-e1954]